MNLSESRDLQKIQEEHYVKKSLEQRTEIWGRPGSRSTEGQRSIWGNRKGTFDKMDEATRKCSIDEIMEREFQVKRNSEQYEMTLESM